MRTYRGSHDLYACPYSSSFMRSISYPVTAYACPSLAEHKHLTRSIPHYVFDGWIDLLHTSPYTHRHISKQDQVHHLLLRFAHDCCTNITRFQDALAYVYCVPGSALGGY